MCSHENKRPFYAPRSSGNPDAAAAAPTQDSRQAHGHHSSGVSRRSQRALRCLDSVQHVVARDDVKDAASRLTNALCPGDNDAIACISGAFAALRLGLDIGIQVIKEGGVEDDADVQVSQPE